MILSELEIMKKIKEAKKFQKLGNFKEAEKVYAGVLRDNENSFEALRIP